MYIYICNNFIIIYIVDYILIFVDIYVKNICIIYELNMKIKEK